MKRLALLFLVLSPLPLFSTGAISFWQSRQQVAIAASSLDPATVAWVAAVVTAGGTVSAPRQTIVNTFIVCLKTASLFTTLDRYWLLAGENAGSAKVDIVSLQSLTIVGSPTFSANNGYTSVNTSNYVSSAFTPSSSGGHQALNSATFGGQVQSNRTTPGNLPAFGAANSAFNNVSQINPLTASGAVFQVNSTAPDSDVDTTSQGSWLASRTAANAGGLYRNGSLFALLTASSTSLPDGELIIGGISQGPGTVAATSPDQLSSFFIAGGLNGTQAANFETCQNAMMNDIGIAVH